ncbi:hypothetical protein QM467_06085 [Rhodoblastus sp. 17X3]|uniref:hypothetical protein n=1 Tax=Rhodoblastus sp. 17X3 TaxID=3047026 RepID=UPI0024B75F82|nr:hypothetical protein [Rhodoblastus sp. 17X3]MDI9847629.1 hypothetical protein [Rhodoblastus sp. 17X3]
MTGSDFSLGPGDSKVSLHDRRMTFPVVPIPVEKPDATFIGTKFTVVFEGNRSYTVNLSDLSKPPIGGLVRDAIRVLWEESQPLGAYKSPGAVKDAVAIVRSFARFVIETGCAARMTGLAAISVADFGAFEAWLRQGSPKESPRPYQRMGDFRQFILCAQLRGMASGDIAHRLGYIADGPTYSENQGKRDAYSPRVAQQVREGAWQDIEAAVKRITIDGPSLAAAGEDPELKNCWSDSNVAWAIASQGLTVLRDNMIFSRRVRDMSGDLTQYDLLGLFHLDLADAFVISTLLSLETGLPIESVEGLKVDCLQNEARGYADLRYVKRRGGAITEKSKRVKVEGTKSPGALIKIVLRLTQTTRKFCSAEVAQWLLVGCVARRDANGSSFRHLKPRNSQFADRFCARHAIVDDKLAPIKTVARVSMRKTFKAAQYKKANGHLADAADDHTKSVHANHYANIPALADVHEATIAAGLEQALASAMAPTILAEADERRFTADPTGLAADRGLSEDDIRAVADGEGDVWLATCLGYHDSPFAAPGENCCPCPVWGCLSCKNAVITTSKLPAVIAFLNHILQRRQEMDLRAWIARFAEAYHRITKDILPRFPEREVVLARAIAAADVELVWLPAEFTMTV